MYKEFVIINAGTRKTFRTLDEVNAHIKKTKLMPLDGSNVIKVDEITTQMHSIAVESDEVTIETFHRLIDLLLSRLKKGNVVHTNDYGTTDIGYMVRALKYLKIPEAFEYLKKEIDLLDIDFDKFVKLYKKTDNTREEWDWIHSTIRNSIKNHGIDAHKKVIRSTCIIILETIKATNSIPKAFKIVRLRTNYKPCNAFGISSDYLSIGIRPEDTVIGSSLFTGRKVSRRGEEMLTEKSLTKLLEKGL
jgi:hypothetical protein